MNIEKYIDHTNLKANATIYDIRKLCEEARQYQFASVCVNSYWITECVRLLADTQVAVCSVTGFPLGAMSTAAKAYEASEVVKNGADEIDMVMNIGALKAGNEHEVKKDIQEVVQAAKGRCVKVILETCLLTKKEIVDACSICMEAGAGFVKTSTGFAHAGADPEIVALMKECVRTICKVKASGGIRNLQDVKTMIEAGADRIGTSAGVQIMQEDQT